MKIYLQNGHLLRDYLQRLPKYPEADSSCDVTIFRPKIARGIVIVVNRI